MNRMLKIMIITSCLLSCLFNLPRTYLDNSKTNSIDISNEYKYLNLTAFDKEPNKLAVECFDVNEDGLIVICTKDIGYKKNICVYDDSGIFQYGYILSVNGTIGLRWYGGSIQVMLVRGESIITIQTDGRISESMAINTVEDEYWRSDVYSPERNVEEKNYYLKNNMGFLNIFASNYSQIVVIDSNGEHLIYDVNSQQLGKALLRILYWVMFFTIALFVIYKTNKSKWKKQNKTLENM